MLVQKEAGAVGGPCLACLATGGPFPGGFPIGTLTRQVLQTRGFLSLGPIICQPLTRLPSHPPTLHAWTGGGALWGPAHKPRLRQGRSLVPGSGGFLLGLSCFPLTSSARSPDREQMNRRKQKVDTRARGIHTGMEILNIVRRSWGSMSFCTKEKSREGDLSS